MNFLKLSMVAIFCSLVVGLMPAFLKFSFSDKASFFASAGVSQKIKTESGAEETRSASATSFLIADKVKIPVYLADTEEKRVKGLGGRTSIPRDYGMFFIFNSSGYQSIWMKDMLFPIDIIWIDENNKIVHIEKNISPGTYPRIFTAPGKALFVLELNAGMSESYRLKTGEKINF